MKKALRITQDDNVATALEQITKDEEVTIIGSDGSVLSTMNVKENIPFGFKVALRKIVKNEKVIKYGTEIGLCYKDIEIGHLAHIHNVQSNRIAIPQERIKQMVDDMGIETLE